MSVNVYRVAQSQSDPDVCSVNLAKLRRNAERAANYHTWGAFVSEVTEDPRRRTVTVTLVAHGRTWSIHPSWNGEESVEIPTYRINGRQWPEVAREIRAAADRLNALQARS